MDEMYCSRCNEWVGVRAESLDPGEDPGCHYCGGPLMSEGEYSALMDYEAEMAGEYILDGELEDDDAED